MLAHKLEGAKKVMKMNIKHNGYVYFHNVMFEFYKEYMYRKFIHT
jgi:hypothetical protein